MVEATIAALPEVGTVVGTVVEVADTVDPLQVVDGNSLLITFVFSIHLSHIHGCHLSLTE